MSAGLTTANACEFARRWVADQTCRPECYIQAGPWCSACQPSLIHADRERLFAWVRDECESLMHGDELTDGRKA